MFLHSTNHACQSFPNKHQELTYSDCFTALCWHPMPALPRQTWSAGKRNSIQWCKKREKLFQRGLVDANTVSRDQCHTSASNTHPETCPKFQQQLGMVAQQ
jgi:hypothetical protein